MDKKVPSNGSYDIKSEIYSELKSINLFEKSEITVTDDEKQEIDAFVKNSLELLLDCKNKPQCCKTQIAIGRLMGKKKFSISIAESIFQAISKELDLNVKETRITDKGRAQFIAHLRQRVSRAAKAYLLQLSDEENLTTQLSLANQWCERYIQLRAGRPDPS